MKKYINAASLARAATGHYWIRIGGFLDIGYLRRTGKHVYFEFQPAHGYFGGGSFALDHDVLEGAMLVGPIPIPEIILNE